MIRSILLAPAVLLAFAVPLRAQDPTTPVSAAGSSQSIDDIRQTYRIHAGPFYVRPTALLKELGVDTNVFNQAVNPQSDFTFTITPQADIALPVARRALLTTTVGADFVYYNKFASERSIDPQFAGRGEVYAHRLTFFADGSYLNTRQRPNYEIDLRSRHLDAEAEAGIGVRVTPKVSLEAAAVRGRVRFEGDAYFLDQRLQNTLNQDTSGYTVTARDRLSVLTTIAVRYENISEVFPLSPVRNSDSYRIMPGVEFKPAALIKGSAYVGYRNFQPRSALLPDYSGLVSQLALSYTLLGATMFGVTYDRDVDFSYEAATPYFVDNSPGIFIRRSLGGRYDVTVNAARHRYDYRQIVTSALPAGTEPRVDVTDNYGASIGYRLKHRTRIGFGASYWTRDSTQIASRSYRDLRVGTSVTYGF